MIIILRKNLGTFFKMRNSLDAFLLGHPMCCFCSQTTSDLTNLVPTYLLLTYTELQTRAVPVSVCVHTLYNSDREWTGVLYFIFS